MIFKIKDSYTSASFWGGFQHCYRWHCCLSTLLSVPHFKKLRWPFRTSHNIGNRCVTSYFQCKRHSDTLIGGWRATCNIGGRSCLLGMIQGAVKQACFSFNWYYFGTSTMTVPPPHSMLLELNGL